MVALFGKTKQNIVIITDRNDLDEQLFDTFAAATQLLRQEPIQADDRQHLKALLKVASGGVVFTTLLEWMGKNSKCTIYSCSKSSCRFYT
jgi:type I restriction enzyme R subunit